MEARWQRSLICTVAALLGAAGVLLCLAGPPPLAGAQRPRALQMWPQRGVGVTSGLVDGSTVHATTHMLPFGVVRTAGGDVVRGRTYLHFPLDVFPPGTDVTLATLHVYVDSGAGNGKATWGVYRALEPWDEQGWSGDPATWPALLVSPIAVTAAYLDVTPSSPRPMQPTPSPTPTAAPTPTPTAAPSPTPTSATSPLSTPTVTATVTSTGTPTPTPSSSPLATATPSPTRTASAVALGQVAGTWLTWDVTALVRGWLADEVPDYGLALAAAPEPDADPETAGDLLVARWRAAKDRHTRPYLIVHFEVHPVTPIPVLPAAGESAGWGGAGLLLVGAALLLVGLLVHRG
ncbi:MAG: DNRLRE domain-containing protein [Anaerolineae bacterium]|jgi:hypothetical protein